MKTTLVKILVPAVLSIAAFGANAAGNGQIPSYGETPVTVSATSAAAVGSLAAGTSAFRGEESPMLRKAAGGSTLSRADVAREAAAANRAAVGTDRFANGYVNH